MQTVQNNELAESPVCSLENNNLIVNLTYPLGFRSALFWLLGLQ